MDNHPRRPPRVPITTAPPPRRLFHHPASTTAHAPRPNPRTTTSKPPTVHIPADTTPDPSADLVERDSSGAYKIIGAPPASLRLSATPPEEEDEEEREQEEHLMGLYGRGASGLEKGARVIHGPHHTNGLLGNKGRIHFEIVDGVGTEEWERDDEWGFWDAQARIDTWEERAEEQPLGVEGWEEWCRWENDDTRMHIWMSADRYAGVMEEVRDALKAGVHRAVASLEGDKWMFEGEKGKGR